MQVLVEPSLKQPLIPGVTTEFHQLLRYCGHWRNTARQQQQQQQQQQQFGTLQSSSHVGTLPTLSIRSASSSAAFHQGPTDPVELRRINFQTPGHPPVPVAQLIDHVASLKASDNLKFSAEYESIDPGQQFHLGKLQSRRQQAEEPLRQRDRLRSLRGAAAAGRPAGQRQNAYIATQGPLPDTIGDFWRMIWEQKTSTVVMMTRLEERSRVKCDMYWPNKGSEVFDYMTVSLLDTLELAYYTIRTFALHRAGATEKREIHHFQFTAWPDHGVPEHCAPLLMFARRVHASNPPDAGPIVAHCSAGVGRTGAFIVIDAMLERMKQEKTLDVYGHVTCLRAQRNYMVQTEDQYIFIHDCCLLEAVICGNTEVPARALAAQVQRLSIPEPAAGGATGMELEFRSLAHTVKPTPAHKFTSASLPANKLKNRLVNILPFESNRVCLQPIRGVEGSDYINASWIDGYRQRSCYIATQGPLPDTAEDFWRMLWEHNSTILREQGRDKCHQYWPGERSARYQYFVVDPMAEYNMPNYILREFKVTDARDGQSRTVRQFHCTDWPEQGVPKSGEGFIEFIGQVHKTKEQFGQDGPITVHCSAGVGRTGVFLALSVVLERMRYEGVVDMYQTVRTLRTQRSAMVQTDEQYQFLLWSSL
uniref:Protein-tyrosine-phosphatase n=1 Tax=Macrostomum lignano TaxID=282301 RepID=A0A1I8FJ74_9PLAT